eukprot:11535346-Karenia_brevis.AAC.1
MFEVAHDVVTKDLNQPKVVSPINISIEGEGRRWLEKSYSDSKLAKKYGNYVPESQAEEIMKQDALRNHQTRSKQIYERSESYDADYVVLE